MNKEGKYRAFYKQMRYAGFRGIRWCFTYEQWTAWWVNNLGSDWWEKRGAHLGEYCMARNGDKGPYAIWNVKCKVVEDNHADRAPNDRNPRGDWHGNAKLTDRKVRMIYLAENMSEAQIGRRFGISGATVGDIKRRLTWRHVTEGLGPSPRLTPKRKGSVLTQGTGRLSSPASRP